MRLLFLYGPVACGKFTIGKEIAEISNFKLFHNHLVVDTLLSTFEFGSVQFVKLREDMWLSVFREAMEADISLVFTFSPENTVTPDFITHVSSLLGDKVTFIKLTCSEAQIACRLEDPTRKPFKKLQDTQLYEKLKQGGSFEYAADIPCHLEFDTSVTAPSEIALQILESI